jgi:hypothetical protein
MQLEAGKKLRTNECSGGVRPRRPVDSEEQGGEKRRIIKVTGRVKVNNS